MLSSGMSRHVALVRCNILEEHSPYITSVTRIGELGTLAVTNSSNFAACKLPVTANVVPNSPILVTLIMKVLHSSETLVLKSHMA
jgi:hypothetical protein